MVGVQKTYNISITNNYGFNIMNFTFGNLESQGFDFPDSILIQKNTTKSIVFKVLTSSSIHGPINVPVSFKFPVDLPNEPTTHNVTITENGFYPDYIIVRQGDTIAWKNNDNIPHEIFSTQFDLDVQPNSTIFWTFQSLGTIEYYDPEWYGWNQFDAIIEVINKTSASFAHNPNYDVTWIVNINSMLNPTNLTIDNSKNYYEIEYGKFKKGLLTITNTGGEIAEVINLSSDLDWISFNKNGINIPVGEEDWVEYSITPVLFDTNQTDKEYNLNIKVQALNSKEYTIPIKVYIPYKEIINELGGSDINTINWLNNVFCPAHPTSFLCDPSIIYANNESGSNSDDMISFNASIRDIFDIKKDISQLKDSSSRTNNELKLTSTTVNTVIPSINTELNSTKQEVKRLTDKVGEIWNIIWIIGGGIIMVVLISVLLSKNDKRLYKEGLLGGVFKYRK